MNMQERGLGRGLNALFRNEAAQPAAIPDETQGSQETGGARPAATRLPIAALRPTQGQPRMSFDTTALEELADSIRSQGIVQPLLVRPIRSGDTTFYEIVAGERRWRAARLAGLEVVPVHIREMSDEEALTAALIENLQREDLNPLEEALAIQTLRDRLNISQEDVAKRLGKSRSAIANALRLLQLPDNMREALRGGSISPGHARALLALPAGELQTMLFEAVCGGRLSVRDAEAAVAHWKRYGELPPAITGTVRPRSKSARAEKPESIRLMISHLRSLIHPKASIAGTDRMGRITLPYESPEQLAALLARLGADTETPPVTPMSEEAAPETPEVEALAPPTSGQPETEQPETDMPPAINS